MSYVVAIKDFFIHYDIFILPATFLLLWVFGVINFCKNVYGKQNKKINACRYKLLKNKCNATAILSTAPEECRRQWRAFRASGAQKPSQTFEFVPRKNKLIGILLLVLCVLVSCVYLAIFITDVTQQTYLVFQIAFYLALAIILVVNKLLFRRKEKRARQIFGKLVAQLNAVVANNGRDAVVGQGDVNGNSVAEKLKAVKRNGADQNAILQASQILRQHGLNANRTAHEQRQINHALNGLLQAYSRHTPV